MIQTLGLLFDYQSQLSFSTMTYPRVMKRARRNRRRTRKDPYSTTTTKKELPCLHSTAAIKGLPKDLLVEVVASVALHSFIDLHSIKTCCKDFLDATEDNYILHRVSLDTFTLIHWFPNEKVSWFLNRCRKKYPPFSDWVP